MPIPVTVSGGGEDVFALDSQDVAYVKALLHEERQRKTNNRWEGSSPANANNTEVYLVKVPSGGIPKFNTGTNALGYAQCNVYKTDLVTGYDITGGATVSQVTYPDSSGAKLDVFNPYPVKWYGANTPLIKVTREKYGLFICEKPPFILDCKPDADIDPAVLDHGTVSIWVNGSDSTDNETAYLDWTAGGQKISAGKEARIIYDTYKNKFTFLTAACET